MSDELNAQGVRCGYRLTLSNLVLPDCRSLGVAIRDFLQERSSLLSQRALAPIDYSHFGPLELLGRRKVLFHNLTVSSRLEGSLKTVANSGQVIVLLRSWDTISKGNKRPFYWLELSVPVKGEYLGPAQITLYGMQPLCNHISEQTQQLGASEDKVVAEILGNPKANPMLDISDKIGELIDDFNATECDRSMFVGTGAKRGLSF